MHTTNANSNKESPSSQDVEHANAVTHVVGTSRQSSEDDENNGRDHKRIRARPMIREEAEDQLAQDSAGEGDVGDVFEGIRAGISSTVLNLQDSVDGSNNLDAGGHEAEGSVTKQWDETVLSMIGC